MKTRFSIKVANGNKYSMTKKLEELFNLENTTPAVETPVEVEKPVHQEVNSLEKSYAAVQEITRNLPQVNELNDLGDAELDDLATKAEKAYDDLMDLGMNVEVRYSSRIFEVASSMLGHAITAKTNKIEKF
jgi:uncharacterized coiled-coil DUF342 family protein